MERISDEERREVAARLRELAAGNRGLLEPKRMGEVLEEAQEAMGTRGLLSVAHVLERYADLIENEEYTCEIVWNEEDETWECDACGGAVGCFGVNYCESCGAKVVE